MTRHPPTSTLFPYTTLFRSRHRRSRQFSRPRHLPCLFEQLAIRREPTANNETSHREPVRTSTRSEEHTSELQSLTNLVCRLLLEKKKRILVRPREWWQIADK